MIGVERPRPMRVDRVARRSSRGGRRRRAPRSCRSRATCGTRRRSAGTARATRASRRARRARGPAPPAPIDDAEHREPGAAHGHHVAVVAEDRQRVRRERPRRDVDHGRRQLAGDLEHVRDHQQQALRRGERRRQRAGLERAVQRAGGAGLALHLDDRGDRAPEVRSAARRTTRRPARPSATRA